MVQIDFDQKSVTVKIVYYGPGMSGKTTNLEVVHQRAPGESRGDLASISTEGDRALFFDFMPLDLGMVSGMRTQLQIYTVPGQVYYKSARKLVLQGVDGVIFVADSSASMMEENLNSLRDLSENLVEYGRDLQCMPVVMQYNKRDIPDALPVGDLERALNVAGWPSHEAVANTGQGVFPTLKALAAIVLESIYKEAGEAAAEVSGAAVSASSFGAGEAEVHPSAPAVHQESVPSGSARSSVPEPPTLAMRPHITPDQGPGNLGQARPYTGTLSSGASGEEGDPGRREARTGESDQSGSHLQMARAPLPGRDKPAQVYSSAGEPSLAESHLRMGQPLRTDVLQGDLGSQGGQGLGVTPAGGAAASSAVAGASEHDSVGSVMDLPGRVTVATPPSGGRKIAPLMAPRIRPRQSVRAVRRESAMITLAIGIAIFVAGVVLGGLIFPFT